MSSKIDVVKFTFRKDWRALNDAVTGKYDAEEFSTATDLVAYASTQTASLIFASLQEKDDLIQLATFVKLAKKDAKDAILKIVVVNFAGNKQFDKAIQKLGILDVVDPYINTKALRFKIDFYMKSLNGQVKSSNKAAMNLKSIEQAKGQEPTKKADGSNWLPPMDNENDIWLIKKDTDCKKVLGRWLIRFMGPGPGVCQWTEVKGKKNAWKLEFKESDKDQFVGDGPGCWYFQGDQKPEFVWKENTWLITGSSFELFFYDEGKKSIRARLKDKVLDICKNSEFALTKEQAILASFDKEHVFKKDGEIATKEEVENEQQDWLKNLEGKGSTDHLETDPLEGKNDPSADQLNTNPMSMDLEPGENNLGNGNMSGKGGSSDDLGGNYAGEGATDKIDRKGHNGPAGDPFADSPDLDMEVGQQDHKTKYKGHNEAEEFDAKDDLLSHAGTKHKEGAQLGMDVKNQAVKTHYAGHNEAEIFEEGELGKHQYEEESKGPMGGKSSTDRIPKFYNKDGTKPDRPLTEEEEKEAAAYEGRGNTDRISSHYGRPHEKGEVEETEAPAEKKRREQKEKAARQGDDALFDDDIGDDYDGESSTDKLKSHYGGKRPKAAHEEEFEEDEEAAPREKKARKAKTRDDVEDDMFDDMGDLGGKSSTDKINGHYSSGGKKKSGDDDITDEDGDDIFARKKNVRKELHEDDSDEVFGGTKKKIAVDKESGKVLPFEKVSKLKPASPLVSEEEMGGDLKEITADASISARITQGTVGAVCVLDDFFDQTILFLVQKSGFNTHDPVKLDLKFKYMQKITNLKFDGKIISIDFTEDGTSFLTVEVSEADAQAFSSFMQLYQQRQENISAFLAKVKGI